MLAILLAVSGLALAASPSAAGALPDPAGAETHFFALLNQARNSGGLAPLAHDAALDGVARDWSTRMSATFDANGNVTVDPAASTDCSKSALCHRPDLGPAVDAASPGWLGAGENIGVGGEVQALHDGLMASIGHRANILGDYDRVGLGVVASGTRMWVTFNFVKGSAPAAMPAGSSTSVPDPASGTAVAALATNGRFTPATPERIIDTRLGGAVAAGGTLTVPVAGTGQVPADATGVVVNVTATGAGAAGYLTLFPCGVPTPSSSTLNFTAGANVANLATSGLGTGGALCVFSNVTTHVLVDLAGWYRHGSGAAFTGQTPSRILDTRSSGQPTQAVTIKLTGLVTGTTAVAVNITATEPIAAGFITAYPCGTTQPATSNVNFTAGANVANAAVVPVAADGTICLAASVPAHLLVDIAGSFSPAGATAMTVVTPARILDTRSGIGGWSGRLSAGQTIDLAVAGRLGVPASARSAVFNVTVTESDKGGYATVYPCGAPIPVVSNVNFNAGETRANQVTVDLGTAGRACFSTNTAASVIADLTGYLS